MEKYLKTKEPNKMILKTKWTRANTQSRTWGWTHKSPHKWSPEFRPDQRWRHQPGIWHLGEIRIPFDSLGHQSRCKPYALKVQVTALIVKCENRPTTYYTRLMKTCDTIDFKIDALTSDTPRSKPFLLQIHSMATNMLKFVNPLRQILETGVKTYRMKAPIR